jgi:hypothetical protein
MPNAKTVPTPSSNNPDNICPSDNPDNICPSETTLSILNSFENRMGMINIQPMRIEPMRARMEYIQPQERLNWGMLSSSVNFSRSTPMQPQPQMDLIQLNWRMLSSTTLNEILVNQERQDANSINELLRFSEDDIDSNSDNDDGFPGLIDENVMTFDDV